MIIIVVVAVFVVVVIVVVTIIIIIIIIIHSSFLLLLLLLLLEPYTSSSIEVNGSGLLGKNSVFSRKLLYSTVLLSSLHLLLFQQK